MDQRVERLHCIMPIANLALVMEHGILSYDDAAKLLHRSVAMQPVQDLREAKSVPQGLRLHRYANLYFDARNPMMFKRRQEAPAICILAVSRKVLRLDGVVVTDRNAASPYARFLHPNQCHEINFDDVFATDWRHPGDPVRYHQHKLRKCAEVLVAHRVAPNLIQGAYVLDETAQAMVEAQTPGLPTKSVRDMFFW